MRRYSGNGTVGAARVRDLKTGEDQVIPTDGLFIFIGVQPVVDLVRGQVELDEYGHIRVDEKMRTSVDGVFALGDVRTGAEAQVVTAMSDGVVAALAAEHQLATGVVASVQAVSILV